MEFVLIFWRKVSFRYCCDSSIDLTSDALSSLWVGEGQLFFTVKKHLVTKYYTGPGN
jgi:hypothetical protein